jgi:hypothetical protein
MGCKRSPKIDMRCRLARPEFFGFLEHKPGERKRAFLGGKIRRRADETIFEIVSSLAARASHGGFG